MKSMAVNRSVIGSLLNDSMSYLRTTEIFAKSYETLIICRTHQFFWIRLERSVQRAPIGIPEIDQAIEGGIPKGSLILVAGTPGSGKTSFAARFLAKGTTLGEKGIYVSFAEGKGPFFAEMRKQGLDFERMEEERQFAFLDFMTVKREGVPAVVQEIVNSVLELGATRLVVDSFSAMAQAFPEVIEARSILHTVLSKIIRSAGCTTILISEVPVGTSRLGLGIEEFVADGVLKFSQKEIEGRVLRTLEIYKLRGTKIRKREHLFTLDGGLKVLSPLDSSRFIDGYEFRHIPHKDPYFSTGIQDLDELLGGGLRSGSHNLLEVSEDVPLETLLGFLAPTITNSIRQGGQVICIPVDGLFPEEMQQSLKRHLGEKGLQSLTIFDMTGRNSPNTISLSGATVLQPFDAFWKTCRRLHKNLSDRIISILGFDALEARFAKDLQPLQAMISETIAKVRSAGDIMLSIARPHLNTLRQMASASDTHLRLTENQGVLCLAGVKPRTGFYGISASGDSGHGELRLVEVS